MRSLILTIILTSSSFSYAWLDIRFGGGVSGSQAKDDVASPPNGQSFSFTAAGTGSADAVIYLGRLGLGGRYTIIDSIASYQIPSPATPDLSRLASMRIYDSGFSGLMSYRFHDSQHKLKGGASMIAIGEFTLTAGPADKFRLLTTDASGNQVMYSSSSVWNYAGSLTGGVAFGALLAEIEIGYRSAQATNVVVLNTTKSASNVILNMPYAMALLGFTF